MIRSLALALVAMTVPSALVAQEETPAVTEGGSMGQLIADGFEIKAAVPNGKSFVVFLQKDSTGYACEVRNLSRSVCGKIN